MAIYETKLPFKPGYVEVEVDGKRTYKNAKTGVLIEDEIPEPTAQDDTDGMAEKLDIFFAADKITEAEYTELTAMLPVEE